MGSDDVTRPLSGSEQSQQSERALARNDDELDPFVGGRVGHFRVDAVLGRGGSGIVYRAWDLALDRPVALKAIRFDTLEARARFQREARAQAKLRHRNVVPVHTVEEAHGTTFLVMDLVEGESLRALMDRGPVPEARAIEIVRAIAAALAAGQQRGLIHRDVKPSNVLVERDGHVLLADFGLAKQVSVDLGDDAGPESMPRSVLTYGAVGSPAYVSPEQARGEEVDHRTDIYSLGVTFYELLTRQRPPRMPLGPSTDVELPPAPKRPREIDPAIRPEVEALVLRMMARDRELRPKSYAELEHELAELERGDKVAPPAARAFAYVVDFFAFGLLSGIVTELMHLPLRGHLDDKTLSSLDAVLAWPIAMFAMGLCEASWGTTPGKRLLRLFTLDAAGGKPRLGPAILRSVVKLFPVYLGMLARLLPFQRAAAIGGFAIIAAMALTFAAALGSWGPALHDRLAHTRVIARPRPGKRRDG